MAVPPKIGAHMSIAGGVDQAVDRAVAAGCDALQVFTKNNNRWAGRELRDGEIERFRDGAERAALQPVVAHVSYLINVASPDDALRRRSIDALEDEVARCETLGIPLLVMHPGSHVGSGEEAAFARIAAALDEIHARRPSRDVTILLENTAGQGTNVGHRFEHLAEILAATGSPGRLGICLDTAHTFAAGYDIGTPDGWDATLAELDRVVGLPLLRALHVNDSKKPLGSRVDRHEHIGLGLLPVAAFLRLMNDERLAGLPALLETPKSESGFEDEQNLAVLRALVGRRRAPSRARIDALRAKALESARRSAERDPGRSPVDRAARRARRPARGSRA